MSINVVNVGTQAHVTFTTLGQLQWTLNVAPGNTNAIIIPWHWENATNLVVLSGTCSDNQGNSYTALTRSQNTSGISGAGAITSGIFFCPSVSSSGGNFIVTIGGFGTTRQTILGNHIEVTGTDPVSPLDQTGLANSGGTAVTTQAVNASAPNASANDLVVAVYTGIATPFFGPGAPSSGYTEITNNILSSNSLSIPCESAYKIVSGIETSSASWTVSGGHTNMTAVQIATFKQASGGIVMIPADWYSC